jgi:hypothetical protein
VRAPSQPLRRLLALTGLHLAGLCTCQACFTSKSSEGRGWVRKGGRVNKRANKGEQGWSDKGEVKGEVLRVK